VSDWTSGGGLSKSAYAAVSSYAPTGAIQQMTLGNGLVEAGAYNDRLAAGEHGAGRFRGESERLERGLRLWHAKQRQHAEPGDRGGGQHVFAELHL
jgi:hypothetical protein